MISETPNPEKDIHASDNIVGLMPKRLRLGKITPDSRAIDFSLDSFFRPMAQIIIMSNQNSFRELIAIVVPKRNGDYYRDMI